MAVVNKGKPEALVDRQQIHDHPTTPYGARLIGRFIRFDGVSNGKRTISIINHGYTFAPIIVVPAGRADAFVKNERFLL